MKPILPPLPTREQIEAEQRPAAPVLQPLRRELPPIRPPAPDMYQKEWFGCSVSHIDPLPEHTTSQFAPGQAVEVDGDTYIMTAAGLQNPDECPTCEGVGIVEPGDGCYTCNGSGTTTPTPGGYEKLCPECGGRGIQDGPLDICGTCDGTGWAEPVDPHSEWQSPRTLPWQSGVYEIQIPFGEIVRLECDVTKKRWYYPGAEFACDFESLHLVAAGWRGLTYEAYVKALEELHVPEWLR